ncbi:MAG: SDR family oxidoreductase [Prevotella sp.]|nr:SDR family oxidoreductase [Prevotella sp.]MBR1504969.1 SDR family oxidoreductase [Prevotella sp.]
MNNIKGKVAIITGASSGIGKALAIKLGEMGARLVLAARREERLAELAEAVKAAGGVAVYKATDVADKQQVAELAEFAVSSYGRIDVLVNNAGVMPASFIVKNCTDEWDRLIDINIKGVLYNIGAVLPIMREQGMGHIVNVSSNAAHTEISPYSTVYCMTKHAVRLLTSGLRQEEAIAGSGIRVTEVAPGMIDTELVQTVVEPEMKAIADQLFSDKSKMLTPSQMADAIVYAINSPEEVTVASIVVQPTKA